MLYTLNLYGDVYQLLLNTAGNKKIKDRKIRFLQVSDTM